MPAVQSRNRQNIHKGEDDRKESRFHPERMPIPFRREQTADRTEPSQAGSPFFRKDIFNVADIPLQSVQT